MEDRRIDLSLILSLLLDSSSLSNTASQANGYGDGLAPPERDTDP
jgi:hypothetical protein